MNAIRLTGLLAFTITMLSPQKVNPQMPNHINASDNTWLIEQTEIEAWRSLVDAAPDSLKQLNGLRHVSIGGGMAINFQHEPTPLFNRVIGLGLTEPLTQQVIDSIKSFYNHH